MILMIMHTELVLTEKVAEAYVWKKSLPVLKSKLGLPRGLGQASKYTNGFSSKLVGNWGKLPFRAPTLVGRALRYTFKLVRGYGSNRNRKINHLHPILACYQE